MSAARAFHTGRTPGGAVLGERPPEPTTDEAVAVHADAVVAVEEGGPLGLGDGSPGGAGLAEAEPGVREQPVEPVEHLLPASGVGQ